MRGKLFWYLKVVLGFGLIAHLVLNTHYFLFDTLLSLPSFLGQALVLLGGVSVIFHYLCLNKHRSQSWRARQLATHSGLYRYVRHPMYLSDMIMYTGFVVLNYTLVAVILWLLSLFALYQQAKTEDCQMSKEFPETHAQWKKRTGLLLPRFRYSHPQSEP